MSIFKLSIIFLTFNLIDSWEDTSELILDIKDGKILGRFITSETGKPVKAFMGIPFAQPPVGDLRFKAPQKALSWDGIKKTQFDGQVCVQNFSPVPRPEQGPFGDEDCLFLNVYAPTEISEKLPILVWIHGGGNSFGDGGLVNNGPDYILENDVILVSINYRLGPLGFLSTEDKNAQGNFGFKDQQLALEWIQENIEYFGGDKNAVTIWGESAGAVSVNYHMLSPTSKGLFQQAISNSGSIHNSRADPWRKNEALEATERLANVLNCPTENSSAIVSCLRSKDAVEIILAADQSGWSNRAVVEDFEELSERAFLPKRAFVKESANIPWMIGMNAQEGLIFTEKLFNNETLQNERISSWNSELPKSLDYDHVDDESKAIITSKISKFYFGTETLTEGFNLQNLTNLYTDASYLGIVEAIKQRLDQNNFANTYVYLFSHKGSASISVTDNYEGTCHADDLIYLFPQHKTRFISSMPTADDETLIRFMPQLWTNFVKFGNPVPFTNFSIPSWPAATSVPFDYMILGNENGLYENTRWFRVDNGLYEDRSNFWMKLRDDHQLSRWNGSGILKLSSILLPGLLVLIFTLK